MINSPNFTERIEGHKRKWEKPNEWGAKLNGATGKERAKLGKGSKTELPEQVNHGQDRQEKKEHYLFFIDFPLCLSERFVREKVKTGGIENSFFCPFLCLLFSREGVRESQRETDRRTDTEATAGKISFLMICIFY